MPYKDDEIRRQKRREWYHRTKETRQQYHSAYQETYKLLPKVKETRRLQHVKRYYNLDAENYLQLVVQQKNLCAICNKPETNKNRHGDTRPLNVDHCHTTGKVRGLLCTHCNTMLGSARDNIETMLKGVDYLKLHKEN